MSQRIILASGSTSRRDMLSNAGVTFDVQVARIDEDAIKDALEQEDAPPRDIADTLAELKAQKVAMKNPDAIVIGSDQVLSFQNRVLSKAKTKEDLVEQLKELRGSGHILLSACVVYEDAKPVWRYVGQARMFMRSFSDVFLTQYVDRNWDEIQHCVGGYQIEAEGARLFERVEGDSFTIMGLPLVPLLSYLALREKVPG